MAKVIVSGNLNEFGNAGQFETDRSTWGFSDFEKFTITRSTEQKSAGLNSARVACSNNSSLGSNKIFMQGRFTNQVTKTYLFSFKIYIPSSNKISPNDDTTITIIGSTVNLTQADCLDQWVSVESEYSKGIFDLDNLKYFVTLFINGGPSTSGNLALNLGGVIYVDELEIYEYIEVEDPPASCDLDIDEGATTITNETSNGAGDGSIEVEETGTGTYEYSKDDGANYQGSNLFTGLTTDIYIVKVRDTGIAGCEDRWPFAVNHAAVTHDFTTVLTHETISGANDGAISFSVTGTGGPFEFSIDAGATWQAGNNFPGQAPGTYFVAVRNAAGNSVVKVVTINAGTVEIDKVYHSKNPVTFLKAASPGWELLTNYRLYDDVRVEDIADSGTYNSKLKMELPPTTAGNAIFYLREAFRDAFTLTPPTQSQSTIERLTDRIKRFKNFSGELTGTLTTPGALTESLPSIVIYGGIDKFHFPDLNYFTTYLQANKKFLTWAPVYKSVDRNQEDYLNFYIYGNFTTLKLRIKAYFDDATNETAVTKTKTGTAFSQLYQIPAGPVNSGAVLVNPGKNVVQYELTLLDQGDNVISETRYYYVTAVRHPLTRFIMFVNSLGAYEVLRFTGQAVDKASFQKDVIQKFLPHNYAALDGEFDVNTTFMRKTKNYSSGYVSGRQAEEWHEYLQDLLLSPRVFDVTDGRRLPVVVTDASHEDQDQTYDRFVRFDALKSYEDESFTPASI